jgi:O-antigen ligase
MSDNSISKVLIRINFLFAILFVFLLPFNNKHITYLIIPWTIVSLILAKINKLGFKEILKASLLFLIFYSFSLVSLIYTKDLNYGIKNLETLVSFILMPFLLLILKTTSLKGNMKYIINAYIIGLVAYIVITITIFLIKTDVKSLINSLGTYTFTDDARYYRLSSIQHESYISMYLIWGIILIVSRLFLTKSVRNFIFELCAVIIFSLYIVILGSRAALITLFVIIIYYLIKFLSRFPNWILIIFTSVAMTLLIIGGLKYTRLGDTIFRNGKSSSSEIRISLWADAFEVFKDAPLFGHGIGDGLNEMVEKHNENGIIEGVKLRLNAHNQFLETATQTGIIGLGCLLLILLIPFIFSIRNRYELLFLFTIIVFINFLFESMLVRLAGVLFLAFWQCFVISNYENEVT